MSATQLLAVQVGEVAGIQVLVTVQSRRPAPRAGSPTAPLLGSFHLAFWIGAIVAVVGFACASFIPRPAPGRRAASGPAG